MALHIINQSPEHSSALQQCHAVSLPGDGIVLIELAAEMATDETFWKSYLEDDRDIKYYVLAADLPSPDSINNLSNKMQLIDFTGLVDLCAEHNPVISW